ncbi:MAG: DNA pilot protein [Microvirus sp.]|nr:MAG: DNA pilot protein [Microvirus sp.]
MAWEAAAISAGANILGGFLQQSGANDRNNAQISAAREQMAFQERMSSTAYQRAMADMRAAGLNPILAYQKGGASTPGGAMPNMENPMGGWGPAMSGAVNSAREAFSTDASVRNTHQDTVNKKVDEGIKTATVDLTHASTAKTLQETSTSRSSEILNDATTAYQLEQAKNARAQNVILGIDAGLKGEQLKDYINFADSPAGRLGATAERITRRAAEFVQKGSGSGSPVPTPTVPTPRHGSDAHKYLGPIARHRDGSRGLRLPEKE